MHRCNLKIIMSCIIYMWLSVTCCTICSKYFVYWVMFSTTLCGCTCICVNRTNNPLREKHYKVQTLGAVALPATTACTDDASIACLGGLSWAIV